MSGAIFEQQKRGFQESLRLLGTSITTVSGRIKKLCITSAIETKLLAELVGLSENANTQIDMLREDFEALRLETGKLEKVNVQGRIWTVYQSMIDDAEDPCVHFALIGSQSA